MIDEKSLSADIVLFDMDGTLLDATAVIERIWTTWAGRHRVDAARLLLASRGQRVAETVRAFAPPGADLQAEEDWLSRQAHVEAMSPQATAGAAALLQSIPPSRWAIVTSAERRLAVKWLAGAGLPVPGVLVTAADVTAGKPHPAGYRLAAQRLGGDIGQAVVFEDSSVGVEAGRAAGANVVGIANPALADSQQIAFWMPDFRALRVDVSADHRITLRYRP